MTRLIKDKSDVLQGMGMQLKEMAVLSEISKAKAREETPDGMAIRAAQDPGTSTNTLAMIAEVGYSSPRRAILISGSCTPITKSRFESQIRWTLTICSSLA
jgi:hypothetical protein